MQYVNMGLSIDQASFKAKQDWAAAQAGQQQAQAQINSRENAANAGFLSGLIGTGVSALTGSGGGSTGGTQAGGSYKNYGSVA